MSVSLYQLAVESPLQMLDALCAIIDKAIAHHRDNGDDPDNLLDQKLADDMRPLRFQLYMAVHTTKAALDGVREGVFSPPPATPEYTIQEYRDFIAKTASSLRELGADDVNALSGKSMVFKVGDREIPFVAENFVLSFSLPNLYFHVTTAYDILRADGVPLGKMDYLGKLHIG